MSAEDSRLLGCYAVSLGFYVISGAFKGRVAFIFGTKQSKNGVEYSTLVGLLDTED